MDTKRKANGGAPVETDDRGSKRRKVAESDLSKGETRETTTAYGLTFLELVRRTADKSGRLVATNFEKLPPRESNAAYYKRTRLPISLETIEAKLNNQDFENLAELESYCKRMISNAKDFYPRSSTTFDDAERLRKVLSNYMTKNNPAYSTRGYQAVPTPLPPEDDNAGEDAEHDESEDGEEEEEQGDDDGEHEDEAPEGDDDGEGQEDDGEEPGSRKRSIILKRRGPTRTSRNSISRPQERALDSSGRPDHQYEGVSYDGLSFQQAQEKLVEELLRYHDPEYEGAYFEPFINLPPRALKDYFKVITEPLSIKKLQKMVKGIHSRGDINGTSNFKNWSAFEDKAKLLWTNAYFYNEEGSEIYALAQELEKLFRQELKQAQAAAPDPAQPKIKLKIGQAPEASTPKKITIHVGGRNGSADSPAPQTSLSVEGSVNGQINGTGRVATPALSNLAQVEQASSVSLSVPSPSPSVQGGSKAEESVIPPANLVHAPSTILGQMTPGAAQPPTSAIQPLPIHNPLVNGYMEQRRLRRPGKGVDDALIASLRVLHHPSYQSQNGSIAKILPHPTEMQQSTTINLPAPQCRIVLISALPDHIQDRQYNLWTMLDKQPLKPLHQQIPGQGPLERVFEIMLHPGVNLIESHLIAAIPRKERVPGGPEVELEVFTVLVNLMRN